MIGIRLPIRQGHFTLTEPGTDPPDDGVASLPGQRTSPRVEDGDDIRAMQRAGTQRAYEQDQRHTEAMARLDQQGRALEALIDGQRKQGEALAKQGAALEILIERTATH